MNKFLRKHNKTILAVAMTLLLIVWLGGSALQSMFAPDTAKRQIAATAIGEIVERDQLLANFETDLLQNLGIPWSTPWLDPTVRVSTEPLGIIEWILLTREAERDGIVPRQIEVERLLDRLGIPVELIYNLAKRRDVRVDSIYAAVGKFIAVEKLARLTVGTLGRSEAAVRVMARDELEKVKVNLVALKAPDFVTGDAAISEADIRAQFEKYRDVEPGQGVNFGYFLPARVQVEYFRIDLAKIADNVRVPDSTLQKRAASYWRANRESPEFFRPPVAEDAEGPVEPMSTYFENFDEARDAALKVVRKQAAQKEIGRVADWLVQELSEPWFDRPEEDGYPTAPEAVVEEGYYQAILERMPESSKYGGAVTIGKTEYFTKDEAARVPGIGQARLSNPSVGIQQFSNLAFHVQGVEPMPEARSSATSLFLTVNQSCVFPLTDSSGNMYVYRVVGVKPPGPAESIDVVRHRIIDDLKLAAAYNAASESARRLLESISMDGLQAAFNADDELQMIIDDPTKPAMIGQRSGYYSPPPFGRIRPYFAGRDNEGFKQFITGVGQVDESFIEACFDLENAKSDPRTGIVKLDALATIAVVEWVERLPIREDEYAAQRLRIVNAAYRTVLVRAVSEWLDPQRIRERNGFELATQ
jgi:hypothetical protein